MKVTTLDIKQMNEVIDSRRERDSLFGYSEGVVYDPLHHFSLKSETTTTTTKKKNWNFLGKGKKKTKNLIRRLIPNTRKLLRKTTTRKILSTWERKTRDFFRIEIQMLLLSLIRENWPNRDRDLFRKKKKKENTETQKTEAEIRESNPNDEKKKLGETDKLGARRRFLPSRRRACKLSKRETWLVPRGHVLLGYVECDKYYDT